MNRPPPRSTRTDTLFPYTTLVRSGDAARLIMAAFGRLLKDVRACTVCAAQLPLGPRPVVRMAASARLMIIGQAPGTKVHERSEEHTSELQSLMRISYAVFCLKKKKYTNRTQ